MKKLVSSFEPWGVGACVSLVLMVHDLDLQLNL